MVLHFSGRIYVIVLHFSGRYCLHKCGRFLLHLRHLNAILVTKQIHIFPQLGQTVPGEPSISYILFFHFKLMDFATNFPITQKNPKVSPGYTHILCICPRFFRILQINLHYQINLFQFLFYTIFCLQKLSFPCINYAIAFIHFFIQQFFQLFI